MRSPRARCRRDDMTRTREMTEASACRTRSAPRPGATAFHLYLPLTCCTCAADVLRVLRGGRFGSNEISSRVPVALARRRNVDKLGAAAFLLSR
jgi:hypothetical protein